MIAKKLRSRRGLTLVETLITLAVFAVLCAALVVGTATAGRIYQKGFVDNEARALQSTLSQSLSGVLRYATNVQEAGGAVTFDSETFGTQVSVISTPGGRIKIGTNEKDYDLLPEKAYTKGLKATATVSYADGFFHVVVTVKHDLLPGEGRKADFMVRALNSNS